MMEKLDHDRARHPARHPEACHLSDQRNLACQLEAGDAVSAVILKSGLPPLAAGMDWPRGHAWSGEACV